MESAEKMMRKGRVEMYEKLSKLYQQVAKTGLEIQQLEYEMRSRGMALRKVTFRPMVEVPLESEEPDLKP